MAKRNLLKRFLAAKARYAKNHDAVLDLSTLLRDVECLHWADAKEFGDFTAIRADQFFGAFTALLCRATFNVNPASKRYTCYKWDWFEGCTEVDRYLRRADWLMNENYIKNKPAPAAYPMPWEVEDDLSKIPMREFSQG